MSVIDNNTKLIKPGVDGAADAYPVYLAQVRRENPDWSFPANPDIADLNSLGYFEVQTTEKPEGEVVEETAPVLEGEVWVQTWVARSFNMNESNNLLQEAKNALYEAADEKLNAALTQGFEFEFTDADGPVFGHVQLRTQDRANVAGLGLKADRLATAGVTTPVLPFRTLENVIYMCTPAQVKDLSDKAYDAFLVYMQVTWQYTDAAKRATTLAELPELPAQFELPVGWESLLSPPAPEEA